MIDRELDIQTADGAMNTFVTHPEEGGPHPVVLFYMDAPGKRGELHDMAASAASVTSSSCRTSTTVATATFIWEAAAWAWARTRGASCSNT